MSDMTDNRDYPLLSATEIERQHLAAMSDRLGAEAIASVVRAGRTMASDATIRRVARPRGELSKKTLRELEVTKAVLNKSEAGYRSAVLAALNEGSFAEVSKATGLSTNTLQRWKREAR